MTPPHYLLCITGLTPQVITETLFALWQEGGATTMPTELHVLSTAEGVERARLTLLSDEPGWFYRLCRDYPLPPIRFGQDHLHVLTGTDGQPLSDIRDAADNAAAADGITDWVRRLTQSPESRVHISIAGGRKTLGVFAGFALSLYGRPQDRLSHVLVQAPFESHPDFFYPTPESRIIYGPPPDKKPLDTRHAVVSLADIPFVRLRHGLPDSLRLGKSRFSDAVLAAQRTLGPPRLEFHLNARQVFAGGIAIPLPAAELAFYAWLARRTGTGQAPIACPNPSHPNYPDRDHAAAFLKEYAQIAGELDTDGRVASQGLGYGMDKNYFERRKSRVNRALRNALGSGVETYLIQAYGSRPHTRYGLSLTAEAIVFR